MQTNTMQTMGEAFACQNIRLDSPPLWGRGAGWFGIGAALASGDSPAGPLLSEAQGQADLALVRALVRALVGRMAADGREVSTASQADAVGDGVLSLARWRAGDGAVRLVPVGRRKRPASEGAAIAWAAIVASVSADVLGDSIPLHCFEDGTFHPAELQTGQDGTSNPETQAERVHRRYSELIRAAGVRALDGKLLDKLPAVRGGKASGPSRANRRKRARVLVKVRRVVRRVMAGERLEPAAAAAGFTEDGQGARGKHSAGDRLLQAVKRAGFKVGVVRRGVHSLADSSPGARHSPGVMGTGDVLGFNVGLDGVAVAVRDGGQVEGFTPLDGSKWDPQFSLSAPRVAGNIVADTRRRDRRAWIAGERFAALRAGTGQHLRGVPSALGALPVREGSVESFNVRAWQSILKVASPRPSVVRPAVQHDLHVSAWRAFCRPCLARLADGSPLNVSAVVSRLYVSRAVAAARLA